MYEPPRTVPTRRRGSHRLTSAPAQSSPGQSAPAHEPPATGRAHQLAGHLAALVAATESLRTTVTGDTAADAAQRAELDAALAELRDRLTELGPVGAPSPPGGLVPAATPAERHDRAHALAGRLLVVAAAQQDTTTAMLACRRMDAHAAARTASA
ncbi:hypothetical protein [Streptacidiphilus sp. EB129]|uniref:SCO4983 family protein n=1 Tax=Streptacidiphilus sp. EB129 TaxID=3156262 RepID=UPI00351171E9